MEGSGNPLIVPSVEMIEIGADSNCAGLFDAPEKSLLALEHCVEIGVDVTETDVRIMRDGYLVMLHDPTIDRTTNGTGDLSDLTLAQAKVLRLRANEGGPLRRYLSHQPPVPADCAAHPIGHRETGRCHGG